MIERLLMCREPIDRNHCH